MARKKQPSGVAKLPNAPLVEAVFELRWELQGPPDQPPPFRTDPGFLQTQEAFTLQAEKLGFATKRDMTAPQDMTAGYGVSRRFYIAPDSEFPILQIGPGIFAANQSAEYEWPSFKQQILNGIEAVLNSYPQLKSFPLTPNRLELRYVDAFDESLVGTSDLKLFLEAGTQMRLGLPPVLLDDSIFNKKSTGRIIIRRETKNWKATQFSLDIGSGRMKDHEIVRSEMKIVSIGEGVAKLRKPKTFLAEIDKWLEFAHAITSPVFKGLVSPNLMKQFGRKD